MSGLTNPFFCDAQEKNQVQTRVSAEIFVYSGKDRTDSKWKCMTESNDNK